MRTHDWRARLRGGAFTLAWGAAILAWSAPGRTRPPAVVPKAVPRVIVAARDVLVVEGTDSVGDPELPLTWQVTPAGSATVTTLRPDPPADRPDQHTRRGAYAVLKANGPGTFHVFLVATSLGDDGKPLFHFAGFAWVVAPPAPTPNPTPTPTPVPTPVPTPPPSPQAPSRYGLADQARAWVAGATMTPAAKVAGATALAAAFRQMADGAAGYRNAQAYLTMTTRVCKVKLAATAGGWEPWRTTVMPRLQAELLRLNAAGDPPYGDGTPASDRASIDAHAQAWRELADGFDRAARDAAGR